MNIHFAIVAIFCSSVKWSILDSVSKANRLSLFNEICCFMWQGKFELGKLKNSFWRKWSLYSKLLKDIKIWWKKRQTPSWSRPWPFPTLMMLYGRLCFVYSSLAKWQSWNSFLFVRKRSEELLFNASGTIIIRLGITKAHWVNAICFVLFRING